MLLKNLNDGSQNERIFAKCLELLKINFTYEPETIELIPTAKGSLGLYKPTFYTPDFKFKLKEQTIIIETKGFMRPRDYLITKLADIHYFKKKIVYLVIQQSGTKKQGNRNFYLHKSKGITKRGAKTKTIWEILRIQENGIYEKAKKIIQKQDKERK